MSTARLGVGDDRHILRYLEATSIGHRVVDVRTEHDSEGRPSLTWLTFRYLNEIQDVHVAWTEASTPDTIGTELLRRALAMIHS